ncbi:MAG: 2-dehydropantoate 2-reductase, partial [Eubacteriales bacterium]|nr:2-dehydropantoate 2-reductase [Eubacteriales bacterium]
MSHPAIKTVSLIGLGSLGIMYAHHLSRRMPFEDLRIIAGTDRQKRY